jgi:hypothetical protein
VYVYVVPWSEFPIVLAYHYYPRGCIPGEKGLSAAERRGNNLERFKDFDLKVKNRIRPGLS